MAAIWNEQCVGCQQKQTNKQKKDMVIPLLSNSDSKVHIAYSILFFKLLLIYLPFLNKAP